MELDSTSSRFQEYSEVISKILNIAISLPYYFLRAKELPSGANMLISREGVAVPNHNTQFPDAFNKSENELFLKSGVPASI